MAADKLDKDLFIRVIIRTANISGEGKRTITTSYNALFLGDANRLFYWKKSQFPVVAFTPYGGKMSKVPETHIPCPHRKVSGS